MEWLLGLVSAILTSIIVSIINKNRRLRAEKKQRELEEQQAEDDLLLGLARLILLQSMESALDQGHTTTTEYEVIDKLYTAYTKRGGNGVIKHLYERYNKLKVY